MHALLAKRFALQMTADLEAENDSLKAELEKKKGWVSPTGMTQVRRTSGIRVCMQRYVTNCAEVVRVSDAFHLMALSIAGLCPGPLCKAGRGAD